MSENSDKKILMIDDVEKLCRLVTDYLAPFEFAVEAVHLGAGGLGKARTGEFDTLILDVMVPEMDGFTILRSLREFSDLPVIMLTALGEETDRIIGLEIGADDYLLKPVTARFRPKTSNRRVLPSGLISGMPGDK